MVFDSTQKYKCEKAKENDCFLKKTGTKLLLFFILMFNIGDIVIKKQLVSFIGRHLWHVQPGWFCLDSLIMYISREITGRPYFPTGKISIHF